jgi:hypothetical protein
MKRNNGVRHLGLLLPCLLLPACEPEHSALASPPSQRSPAVVSAASRRDRPAPPFELRQLGGGRLSLASLRGKVVLLAFWLPG